MTLPAKPSRQISDDSGLDASDKSLSQPSVAIRETDILGVDSDASPPPTPWGIGSSLPNSAGGGLDAALKKDPVKSASSPHVATTTLVASPELSQISQRVDKKDVDKKVIIKASPSISPSVQMLKSSMLPASLMSASLISVGSKVCEKDRGTVILRNTERRGSTGGSETLRTVSSILPDTTPEDFSVDIDSALEEVMAGLKSLEMQQKQDKRMSLPAVKLKQTPKHTPDLVLDLPDGNISSSSTDSIEPDSPTISAAENFAKSNQGTLKKATAPPVVRHDPSSRLSASFESGNLTCPREHEEDGITMISSQPALSTFSLKKTQHAVPTKSQTADTHSQSESSTITSSSPNASPPISTMTSAPVLMSTPPVQPIIPASGPQPPPPVAQKPKPPMKVKPPVMKKPLSRPDISSSPPLQPPP